jgi:hypothetical protein
MEKLLLLALTLFCMEANMEAQEAQNQTGKILVAYFSWGGNTRRIARQIHQRTGGRYFRD